MQVSQQSLEHRKILLKQGSRDHAEIHTENGKGCSSDDKADDAGHRTNVQACLSSTASSNGSGDKRRVIVR